MQKHQNVYGSTLKCDPNDNLPDSESFKFKVKKKMKSPAVGKTKNVKIPVSLKYFSNIWITLEMHLIRCKINPIFTWSANCVITNSTGAKTFSITDAKLYIPVVTLLTEDNTKLLKQN